MTLIVPPNVRSLLTLGICDGVPKKLDWQHFTARDPTFKQGTTQVNPGKLTYTNSANPFVVPLMSGELWLWNKFFRRWESGAFCITRTGYLMRFEKSLTELKHNITPTWSLNLTTTLLGDLITVKGQASFTLFADRYSYRGYSHGARKIIKAPIRFAKNTMSQLTRVKFGVHPDQGQRWHRVIAGFSQQGLPVEMPPEKKPKTLKGTFGHNDAAPAHHSAAHEEEEKSLENEVVSEDGSTDSNAENRDQYETDDSWERDMYKMNRATGTT